MAIVSRSWFGSSGGGLPERPKLKSLGRFSCALLTPSAVATSATAVHQIDGTIREPNLHWRATVLRRKHGEQWNSGSDRR